MNSFHQNQELEQRAYSVLIPFVRKQYPDVVILGTKELQTFGDLIIQKDNVIKTIEVKAEAEQRHGNFFFETWSNRRWSKLGWVHTIKSNILFYYFLDTSNLYIMEVPKMLHFLLEEGNIWEYPERLQGKHKQLNDTWGRCVPINDIVEQPWCSHTKLCRELGV